MQHGPPAEWGKDKSQGFKTKLGLIMFAAYTTLYMVFVLLCVLKPKLMATDVGPLNLAVAFGMALIIIAIIQALVYNYMSSKREKLDESSEKKKEITR
jgi:uncharacterized membrane protein (DUF485 family)